MHTQQEQPDLPLPFPHCHLPDKVNDEDDHLLLDLLQTAKRMLEEDRENYICFAISEAKGHMLCDVGYHNRGIYQAAAGRLINMIDEALYPSVYYVRWLANRGLINVETSARNPRIKAARLRWVDDLITRLEARSPKQQSEAA